MEIQPIAQFRGPFTSKFGLPRQSGLAPQITGQIVFESEFRNRDALRGLDGFDLIWVIWEFSANSRRTGAPAGSWQPTVRPPRLGGNTAMGVFATRSPFRPNPLGLSALRIDHIDWETSEGPVIHVLGGDLMDGTPIYDIKPYLPYADAFPDARAGFVDQTEWKPLQVVFPEHLRREFAQGLPAGTFAAAGISALEQVLSLDPRPHYQQDPDKEYGMMYAGMDIHFRVRDNILTITQIDKL